MVGYTNSDSNFNSGVAGYGGDRGSNGVYGSDLIGSGVHGSSPSGIGVSGYSTNSVGVTGLSERYFGVRGHSYRSHGLYGTSSLGNGVSGFSYSVIGAYGESSEGVGVYGNSNDGVGVYGTSVNGLAALFEGNVRVTGTLTKRGGAFKIDHPLDPANKYLSHSFVESPDMKNVYDGVVVLDDKGEADDRASRLVWCTQQGFSLSAYCYRSSWT